MGGGFEVVRRGVQWGEVQPLDYVAGNPTYIAKHPTHKTATSAPGWWIWKLTWVTGNCTRVQGPLMGIADGRAALSW